MPRPDATKIRTARREVFGWLHAVHMLVEKLADKCLIERWLHLLAGKQIIPSLQPPFIKLTQPFPMLTNEFGIVLTKLIR